ncbi:MAG: TetR/AcrR family transcriptional regulator [Myxococcota bacterium]
MATALTGIMSRRPGQLNPDHHATRERLLGVLTASILEGERLDTFAKMAKVAGVSRPTLQHYFGDLEGVHAALLSTGPMTRLRRHQGARMLLRPCAAHFSASSWLGDEATVACSSRASTSGDLRSSVPRSFGACSSLRSWRSRR